MTLSEWIESTADKPREQIADVTAQLLSFCCDNCGRLSASGFSLSFSEKGGYFDLIPDGSFAEYEKGAEPPPYDDGDIIAGNVYVCGLLLYKMLKGKLPDDYDVLVQRAAVAAGSGAASPVLSLENSPFGGLLAALTEISSEKRADALTALDMLAAQRAGSAMIRLVEEETGVQVERVILSLDKAFTVWRPFAQYGYDGQVFFPSESAERSFPYRACELEYVCKVRPAGYSAALEVSFVPAPGTVCLGIDLGSVSSVISFLDDGGRVFEKPSDERISVQSAAAAMEDGTLVFGSAALKLCEESGAELIRCFAPDYGYYPDAPVTYAACGGNSIALSLREIVSGYMSYIRQLAESAAGKEKAVTAGFILPPDTGAVKWREVVDGAVKGFGWNVYYTDCVTASVLYFRETQKNALDESVMVFDIGESAMRAGLAEEEAVSEAGGYRLTNIIAEKLMRDLLADDIDLSSDERRRLDGVRLSRGRRAVLEAAESLKKRLSFDTAASHTLKLDTRGGENTRTVGMTRNELEDLIAPVLDRIEKSVTGIIRSANMDAADIRHIVITGGGSLTPAVSGYIRGLFPAAKAYFPHNVVFASRGAAMYACSRRFSESSAAPAAVSMDYGVQKINAADGRLRFECLLKAGTEYSVEESARIIYRLEAGENDISDGSFIMKLYTRPRGMEHVTSTLSPENAIKYIGRAEAKIPSGYDKSRDAVDFIVSVHADGRITAEAEHMRKPKAFPMLKRKETRDNMEMAGRLQACFVPAL